jgi:O-antigen ligase
VERTAGTGLIGVGAVLAVVGAILKYAVSITVSQGRHFNVNTAGEILLIAGIVLFVTGLAFVGMAYAQARRRETMRDDARMRDDVRSTPQERQRTQGWGDYR